MHSTSRLIVVRGFPYEEGETVPIRRGSTVLGRKDAQWEPDIGFGNAFVSRKQATIYFEEGVCYIMDLGSKHGTDVNGSRLAPFAPAALRTSDSIAFAKGMVRLTYSANLGDETMDFTPLSPSLSDEVLMDPVRQTVLLHGRSCRLSDKEYRCLELLMRNKRRFVEKEAMIRHVWPERAEAGQTVGSEEINSLLYRIRKKTNHGLSIENIRGRGYVLQDRS